MVSAVPRPFVLVPWTLVPLLALLSLFFPSVLESKTCLACLLIVPAHITRFVWDFELRQSWPSS